jgi:exodeoxyribonuclease VII large subunit
MQKIQKIIELNVPYLEKNIAKQLGAKWHATLKTWFITDNMDVNKFTRWIPKDQLQNIKLNSPENNTINYGSLEQSNSVNPKINYGSLEQPYSLLFLTNKIQNIIQQQFSNSIWLIAEVSELKAYNNNLFLGLVEYDDNGTLLAKSRGIIWNTTKIIQEFTRQTNIELKSGIKILVKANLDYHLQYGLTLIINELDPSYTLGEANAKLAKIKQQLIADKIFTNNKNLSIPVDFYNIAVISPQNAAGLGDFKQDATVLAKHKLCNFDYYIATFQGTNTHVSVLKALENINQAEKIYDAVVIIRGGGATADLTWLNEYSIAKAICLLPIPVFSGIGHNKDQTIIDQIANQSFDTPSKVINYITHTIINNSKQAIDNIEYIYNYCNQILSQTNANLVNLFANIKTNTNYKIQHINTELNKLFANLPQLIIDRLTGLKSLLELTMQQILAISPEKTLARGFNLAYGYNNLTNKNNLQLITSVKLAKNYKKILLKFSDGEITGDITYEK